MTDGETTYDKIEVFCRACRGLQQLESVTQNTRELRASMKSSREAVVEEMVRTGRTYIPVRNGYAVLRERRTTPPLTSDLVLGALARLRPEELASEAALSPQSSLPELLEAWVARTLKSSGVVKHTLSFRPTLPRAEASTAAPTRHQPPSESLFEATARLEADTITLKRANASMRAQRQPLREQRARVETAVAEHILRAEPETSCQTITLQEPGHVGKFCLRRKERTRCSRPTVRTLLPALRKVLLEECGRYGIAGATPHTLARLQSADVLGAIRTKLEVAIDKLRSKKTTVGVTLTHLGGKRNHSVQ